MILLPRGKQYIVKFYIERFNNMENNTKKSVFNNLSINLISEILKFLPKEEVNKLLQVNTTTRTEVMKAYIIPELIKKLEEELTELEKGKYLGFLASFEVAYLFGEKGEGPSNIDLLQDSLNKLQKFNIHLEALEKLINTNSSSNSSFITRYKSLEERYHNLKNKVISDFTGKGKN